MRSRFALAGLGAVAAAAALAALARRWFDVVEVQGGSMSPALQPGDRLLVERWTYARRAPRSGEVVLAHDPRSPDRELVKRVGIIGGRHLTLHGDAAHASTDSRVFGSVPIDAVRWRVSLRYWPLVPRGAPAPASPRSRPATTRAPSR